MVWGARCKNGQLSCTALNLCRECRASHKYTVGELLPEVRALYKRSPVGCCLHIVLDDGNVKDRHVQFCIDYAVEKGHAECEALARKLLTMTPTQRHKLHQGG